jgi:hypothetical protein
MTLHQIDANFSCEPSLYQCPEKQLMFSLIISAIRDIQTTNRRGRVAESYLVKKRRDRALCWIESNALHCDTQRGISFLYACDHVGVCPKFIRERLETLVVNQA